MDQSFLSPDEVCILVGRLYMQLFSLNKKLDESNTQVQQLTFELEKLKSVQQPVPLNEPTKLPNELLNLVRQQASGLPEAPVTKNE